MLIALLSATCLPSIRAGYPKYDQTVVVEHIARLEKKMEATQ